MRVEAGEKLLIHEGFVLNVAEFMNKHPGGKGLLDGKLGQDVTKNLMGTSEDPATLYKHSVAAHNTAATLRVARLK